MGGVGDDDDARGASDDCEEGVAPWL
jgi:hypothetical protein